MKHTKPTICVFGSYDENLLSSQVILKGLPQILPKSQLHFVHESVPASVLFDSSHLNLSSVLRRMYHRILAEVHIVFHVKKVHASDVVLVLPFGLLDLIPAFFFRVFWGKIVIYVPQNSLYDLFQYASEDKPLKKIFAQVAYHFERLLYRIPNEVFFNTESEATAHKTMLNLPNLHTGVIPLGADDSLFKPVLLPITQKRTFEVLFYGEYNLAQGTELIVRAAHELRAQKNIHITMIGDGRTRKATNMLATELGVTNVTFLPWLNEKDLKKYIDRADVVLGMFTSNPVAQRVIPNKVYQALACGKCVITARSSGATAWLTHRKNVYFVPMDSPKGIANAIRILKRNSPLRKRIAKEGYAIFSQQFSSKAVATSLVQNIQSIWSSI